MTDDTHALQRMLADPKCKIGFLPKGYFAVTRTLTLPPGFSLVGVGRIYSNIVAHASVANILTPGAKPWPLLETASPAAVAAAAAAAASAGADVGAGDEIVGGASTNTIGMLSVLVWHHINTTYAVHFQSPTVWR